MFAEDYEGLNNQEIAHRLKIPVGTVKNYYTQSIHAIEILPQRIILMKCNKRM
jgi:DNA-directed RNA polymerase specialized sigma24 family protein